MVSASISCCVESNHKNNHLRFAKITVSIAHLGTLLSTWWQSLSLSLSLSRKMCPCSLTLDSLNCIGRKLMEQRWERERERERNIWWSHSLGVLRSCVTVNMLCILCPFHVIKPRVVLSHSISLAEICNRSLFFVSLLVIQDFCSYSSFDISLYNVFLGY